MPNDDAVVKLLASIDRRLALLTAPQDRDLQEALETEILRTKARIAMFDGIDGVRGSSELAKLGGVSNRMAQLFVKELLELGLVRPVDGTDARVVIVEHDDMATVTWYLRRDVSGESNGHVRSALRTCPRGLACVR